MHGRPQFSGISGQIPLLGQQQAPSPEAQIQAAVFQLTISIYQQVIAHRLSAEGDEGDNGLGVADMQLMAQRAQTAARAFFEGLGVAQFPKS